MAGPITFAGGTLDRVADRRTDEAWVAGGARRTRGRRAVVGGPPRACCSTASAPASSPLDGRDGRRPARRATPTAAPVWAVEAREGEELSRPARWRAGALATADAGLLAYAQAMLHWHRTHRFCGRLRRRPLRAREAGFARACPNGHDAPPAHRSGRDHARRRRRPLRCSGRQAVWPPGRYSALAGFVEPGETLEAAVAREVRRRRASRVGDVRYRASQPWPFPAQLMIGFEAEYAGGEARRRRGRARGRALVHARGADGGRATPTTHEWLLLPPPIAIARRLVDRGWRWLMDFALRETVLHGRADRLPHRRIRARRGAHPRDAQLVAALARRGASGWPASHTVIAPDLHGHGRLGRADGRLLARRARRRHPRPARRARHRPRDDRRPLARRRRRDAVLLPVPRALSSAWRWSPAAASAARSSWPLRIAAAPGVEALLAAATSRPVLGGLRAAVAERLRRWPAHRALAGSSTPEARRGFLWTLRSVIGLRGQKVARQRPPLPARRLPDADRLGRPRPHHPGRPRPRRARARRRAAVSSC